MDKNVEALFFESQKRERETSLGRDQKRLLYVMNLLANRSFDEAINDANSMAQNEKASLLNEYKAIIEGDDLLGKTSNNALITKDYIKEKRKAFLAHLTKGGSIKLTETELQAVSKFVREYFLGRNKKQGTALRRDTRSSFNEWPD